MVGLVAQQDPSPCRAACSASLNPRRKPPAGPVSASNPKLSEQTDANLCADAAARPRRRRQPEPSAPSPDTASTPDDPEDDDLPPWAHHSQVDPQQLTPMLRHYVELKAAHPERVLLYRLGDFFECFFEDAIQLSRLLELTLTGKEGGKAIGRVPMAGIPHHAAERYCAELIRRGCCVALCDQLETTPAKGALLKRDITRVLTPGTVLEEGLLSARRNNWLAAVVVEGATRQTPFRWGLVSADVSTGEVKLMQRQGSDNLHQELSRLDPSELLWSEPGDRPAWCPDRLQLTPMTSTPFSRPEAEQALLLHYQLATIDGLGLPDLPLALRATGGLLAYLRDTQPLEENNRVPLE